MCLYNDTVKCRKFLDKYKNRKTVTVYKRLTNKEADYNIGKGVWETKHINKLISPYLKTEWLSGWNVSNSKAVKPRTKYCEVNLGMHVYLNKDTAERFKNDDETVVPLTVYVKDFIGADDRGNAVFRQAYLSRKNYREALKA